MNAPSVPVRMIVSRWITARKQLTNAKRPTIAGNERAPNRALNSARPGRKNILSAPTEAPASAFFHVSVLSFGLRTAPVQLTYSPVLLPCNCVAATPYNPRQAARAARLHACAFGVRPQPTNFLSVLV